MVFIEGLRGNVLFTGDFRLPSKSTLKLPIFSQSFDENKQNNLKSVDNLYIDMTFFKPAFPKLPNREESVITLIQFLKNFLELNKKSNFLNLVYLKTSARIGYEFVFQEIYRCTGFKIHVNNLLYRLYEKIPTIRNILTLDPYQTPIHNCIYDNQKRKSDTSNELFELNESKTAQESNETPKKKILIPCLFDETKADNELNPEINAVKIILSAMYFTDNPGIEKIFIEYKPSKNERHYQNLKFYKKIYRLCYSFHSSMEEIVNFVNSLKPKKIYPIALPESTSEISIRTYFFDQKDNFNEFHFINKINMKDKNDYKLEKDFFKSKSTKNNLIVKKRSYCEISSFEQIPDHNSSNEESDGSENDCLIFNDFEESSSFKKCNRF